MLGIPLEQLEALEAPISLNEVLIDIDALKVGKAQGPDGFLPEFYKTFKFILGPKLQSILTSALEAREVPASWREALIVWIPK